MKITVTPAFIHGAKFDTATETAIMKSHKPRAAKIANVKNLFALLAQHYGTARDISIQSVVTDRWYAPDMQTKIPVSNPDLPVEMKSHAGILTVENTVSTGVQYPVGFQNIFLYIPLDPAGTVTVRYQGRGMYPVSDKPCIVYYIEIA